MIFLTGQEDPQASGGKEPRLLYITVVIGVVARFLAITTLLATVLQLVHPLRLIAAAAWHAVVGVVMLVGVVAVAAAVAASCCGCLHVLLRLLLQQQQYAANCFPVCY